MGHRAIGGTHRARRAQEGRPDERRSEPRLAPEYHPDEPDIPLYRGYPIARDSFRRKLVRDATGRTGWKLFKNLLRGAKAPAPATGSYYRYAMH